MKSIIKYLYLMFALALIFVLAEYPVFHRMGLGLLPLWIVLFVCLNIFPACYTHTLKSKRLRICQDGCELLYLFLLSTVLAGSFFICGCLDMLPVPGLLKEQKLWILTLVVLLLVENILFWNGMIRVYLTSVQLGIRIRVIGIITGMIPVANLVVLGIILKKVAEEVQFENQKILLNEARKEEQICKTKYPILMVHGVFFRDFRYLNYWGRVPAELEKNGALIFYGKQQSAASVEDSAHELAKRIDEILSETKAEKVNIIAHSKGGLDSRFALTLPGMADKVASLSTINTPHRGCEFADYLLSTVSKDKADKIASTYNAALLRLGDPKPDFMAAVSDLTASACKERNEVIHDVEGVYYQSVGSKLKHAVGGRFPTNFSYLLVKHFDGNNDGLVGENSFPWGEEYTFLEAKGKRGISHGDMIDLNRENFKGFDVREFYVQLVKGLKEKGF